eukprot:Polyplicarium_translucidae@DN3252_c1_g1_i4.p1
MEDKDLDFAKAAIEAIEKDEHFLFRGRADNAKPNIWCRLLLSLSIRLYSDAIDFSYDVALLKTGKEEEEVKKNKKKVEEKTDEEKPPKKLSIVTYDFLRPGELKITETLKVELDKKSVVLHPTSGKAYTVIGDDVNIFDVPPTWEPWLEIQGSSPAWETPCEWTEWRIRAKLYIACIGTWCDAASDRPG